VDVERSDRLFAVIERANRVIDRIEGRLGTYQVAS
jgi:hypothetical protein